MKALWKDTVVAESDDTVVVENNHYFPPETVNRDLFIDSDLETYCPWKGKANYYHLKTNGEKNENAAWYYPDPSEEAAHIKDYVAFWRGVKIVE
ncbi:MAG: DUF427 domain-containing protein [Ignavibacteriales bacterium]|nr:DUF427 domain-containing protein [Ignavibacteriales bacterium]